MPEGERKHIAEALGGDPVVPPNDEERVERERVRNLIETVAACYHTLANRELDTGRRTELTAKLAFYDAELRRLHSMSADERREVIRTYPELLRRLRAEIDR
ncbi:hypothetical protein EV646_110223 [Kribbella antiqua]|uniref:Uncharacterized protein n=1 Tax=Kribbella antiqua TaxID=2512217 RepID=A0A4R2IKU0_9ACTN|nr:hypothetical protein [Kribbella antiqua]TCO44509.1 hypothetical protein EV646_110223 [Kribbella antiqua]